MCTNAEDNYNAMDDSRKSCSINRDKTDNLTLQAKGILVNGAQRAKEVVSDSLGLVDFAIGLVNSVFNLPDGQVIFFEEFEKQKNCEINSVQKAFGLVEMTSGLVNVSFSLPEWQAVKMIFFATWVHMKTLFKNTCSIVIS